MNKPPVSVAMATYNGGRFLREQLDSIALQRTMPIELVVGDDGSTDDTVEILERFGRTSKFPVHIHRNPEKLGYFRNFHKTASRCQGELIAFSDQDDWWDPQRLEKCVARFDDPGLLLLYHNAWLVDDERRKLGVLYDREAEQRALELKPIGPWNHSYGLVQIFRASLRQFDDLWDRSLNHMAAPLDIMCHDQWYFFLAQALGRVDFFDERLVEYRQHGANAVGAGQMRPAVETRIFARLRHYGSQDFRMSKAAAARAEILTEISRRFPEKASYLQLLADHYQLLSDRSLGRFRTYSEVGWRRRLGSLFSCWRRGDYADWPWGFDRRSVLRDLWNGVLLARLEPDAR